MPELSDVDRAKVDSNADRAHVTRRGRWFYNLVFDIQKGEHLLDLGPGVSRYRPNNSVGIDRAYLSRYPATTKKRPNVAGLFQTLPFRDGVFDRVVASYSMYWVKEGKIRALSEGLRVLQSEGFFQIFPANKIDGEAAHDLEKKGITDLKEISVPQILAPFISAAGLGALADEAANVVPIPMAATALSTAALEGAVLSGWRGVKKSFNATIGSTLTINNSMLPKDPLEQMKVVSDISNAYGFKNAAF